MSEGKGEEEGDGRRLFLKKKGGLFTKRVSEKEIKIGAGKDETEGKGKEKERRRTRRRKRGK